MKCRICDNDKNNKTFDAKEMMFGYQDKFTYFQCSNCNCLQISKIPKDISKYYPSNYYSFSKEQLTKKKGFIKSFAKKQRDTYAVFKKSIIGKLISVVMPEENLAHLSNIPLTKKSRILDVGCGAGAHLYTLKEIGFENLLGVDPFIDENIEYENGLKILKDEVNNIKNKWDLIMLHHSFEHMEDPVKILKSISKILETNGVCLIRIPVVPSYVWEQYRENWVSLDPPRHFFIHSADSINFIADKVGLKVERIEYDSTEFQFWGSEQYKKGITLMSDESYATNPSNIIFSKKKIKEFRKKSKSLNKLQQGDQAGFYLVKK